MLETHTHDRILSWEWKTRRRRRSASARLIVWIHLCQVLVSFPFLEKEQCCVYSEWPEETEQQSRAHCPPRSCLFVCLFVFYMMMMDTDCAENIAGLSVKSSDFIATKSSRYYFVNCVTDLFLILLRNIDLYIDVCFACQFIMFCGKFL